MAQLAMPEKSGCHICKVQSVAETIFVDVRISIGSGLYVLKVAVIVTVIYELFANSQPDL
jgi:hypothetical protein